MDKEIVKSVRSWTPEEIEYLKENFGIYSDKLIASNLNRSIYSIISKAQKLNIRKIDNGELINVTDFCESTGIHRSSIEYWIKNCDFPTTKKGKYRKISSIKFWKWAENNKSRITWSDFPRNTIFGEPDRVAICREKNINRTSKRREWAQYEINELKRLLSKEKYTYIELSKKLNRSHAAIKRKIYDLGLLYTPIYQNKNNYYSNEEINKAIKQLDKGIELVVVAEELNRSEMGLRGKLERIGYL